MAETYVHLDLPPGLARNGTAYQNRRRWINGHLMRWVEGAIRPVGGWLLSRTATGGEIDCVGFPRGAHSWRKNDRTGWVAVGTTGPDSRLYAFSDAVLTDITPAGLVDGLADGSLFTGSGNFGEGNFGDGPFGGGSSTGVFTDADTWQLDNFGEILVACLTADGKLYFSTPTTQAAQIAGSPTGCRGLVVTNERFLFALGAGGDPRKVQWPARETLTTWTAGPSNNAGAQILATNGRLIAGRRTSRETLLWTDADVWGAVFLGAPFVYSFQQRGDNCGLISPNAVAIVEGGAAFWMGNGQFWQYDGAVRALPCDVSDYVFGDLNMTQRAKIAAVPIPQFGEVWWFYPSATQSGSENNRYVALNYRQGFWMTGNLGRAAGVGAGVFSNPQMFDSDGKLYTHELGSDRSGEIPFLESGPLELENGNRVVRVQKLIPDEKVLGQVEAMFFAAFQPMGTERTYGPYPLLAETNVRFTGRQIRVRLAEAIAPASFLDGSFVLDGSTILSGEAGQDFRIGSMRLGAIAGGRR